MKNRKGINYVLVFLIPILVMMVLYTCIGVYPFGKKSLLTVDLAGQYVAFFNSLKNIFTGDISMFFMALILISSLVGSLYLYKKNLVDLKK